MDDGDDHISDLERVMSHAASISSRCLRAIQRAAVVVTASTDDDIQPLLELSPDYWIANWGVLVADEVQTALKPFRVWANHETSPRDEADGPD